MPPNRHIIGIRISGNPVDHIETTITLLIFIKKVKISDQIHAWNVYFLKHEARI